MKTNSRHVCWHNGKDAKIRKIPKKWYYCNDYDFTNSSRKYLLDVLHWPFIETKYFDLLPVDVSIQKDYKTCAIVYVLPYVFKK